MRVTPGQEVTKKTAPPWPEGACIQLGLRYVLLLSQPHILHASVHVMVMHGFVVFDAGGTCLEACPP